MPRFAANLSLMYNEHAFLDRFAAARADGFEAVEYLFPYAFASEDLARRLKDNALSQVLFNAPPGDFAAGERGIACLPGREEEFRSGIPQAIEYALALGCPRIHVMAGIAPIGVRRDALRKAYIENLVYAAQQAGRFGLEIMIEPINTRDMPSYFLNRQQEAHDIVSEAGEPNIKVQFDLYHCQIVEGDLEIKLRQYLAGGQASVGHIQIAGVPHRHEPDQGEVNFDYLFGVMDELNYPYWIGCEYRPRGGTSAGLDWLRRYRDGSHNATATIG
jgi:2-dehydrotetronate isomerase